MMIQHGIHNTKAFYWIHLFPLEGVVYWYRVDAMRSYIQERGPPIVGAKSKNGSETGRGYLIPRDIWFVQNTKVLRHPYLDHIDWKTLTDRELGMAGERVVIILIEHQIITLPLFCVKKVSSKSEQFSSIDLRLEPFKPCIEVKTETPHTPNLFVQSAELHHVSNLCKDEMGETKQRDTEFDDFLGESDASE